MQSVTGPYMLAERLQQLEVRIREAVALLENLRAERNSLQAKVAALEADLARGGAGLKALGAERDQERSHRQRLEAERGGGSGEERVHQVRIFGETYALRSADPPDYVQQVGQYVDEKFYDIAKGSPNAPVAKMGGR